MVEKKDSMWKESQSNINRISFYLVLIGSYCIECVTTKDIEATMLVVASPDFSKTKTYPVKIETLGCN